MIIRLLLRLYLKKNREIHGLTAEEELELFMFKNPNDVEMLFKKYLTVQTLRYFEADGRDEQYIIKGGALMLKLMKDLHNLSCGLHDKFPSDPEKQIREWKKNKIIINNNSAGQNHQPK